MPASCEPVPVALLSSCSKPFTCIAPVAEIVIMLPRTALRVVSSALHGHGAWGLRSLTSTPGCSAAAAAAQPQPAEQPMADVSRWHRELGVIRTDWT